MNNTYYLFTDSSSSSIVYPVDRVYNFTFEALWCGLFGECKMSENEVIEPDTLAGAVDNQRLQVLTRSSEGWKTEVSQKMKCGPTLDEITNRVFEELLQGKAARITTDQESVRSDDWESENSSGIFALVDKVRTKQLEI
uniref:Uncharacterized protein n=1 Tax=Timema shepardi TaxID=629360 RepID=A0A7R9BA63_TIMSH|nr:unnamed protein product [Timema shepardi]